MIQTIEAVIDEHGNVRLLEPVRLAEARAGMIAGDRAQCGAAVLPHELIFA